MLKLTSENWQEELEAHVFYPPVEEEATKAAKERLSQIIKCFLDTALPAPVVCLKEFSSLLCIIAGRIKFDQKVLTLVLEGPGAKGEISLGTPINLDPFFPRADPGAENQPSV